MLTYEQAYEAALRQMPNIDACVEYENAYMFKRKAENHSIGGHGFNKKKIKCAVPKGRTQQ